MKKRIWIGLAMLVLLLSVSVFAVTAAQEGVYCPHCDTYVTDWTEWTAQASGSHSQTAGGHFYLSKDFKGMGGRYGINSGSETVVLDLRGHTIESTNNRAFFVSGGTLAIMDSVGGGTLIGARDGDGNLYVASGARIDMYGGTAKTSRTSVTSSGSCGSVLYVLKGGTFNLYGGTLDGSAITTRNTMSGTACVKGTLNVYGGTISGGNATNGGNVYLDGGTLYMTGGTITGGQAVNGGNIYTKNAATVTISQDTAKGTVATVTKGHATTSSGLGGNLCVNGGSTVNLTGGKITDGISDARGGNISNGGANTYHITAGEMTGGSAGTDGENMFVNNGSVALNISGGYIDGGMDIRLTPNIKLSGNPVISGAHGGLVLNLGTTQAKLQPGAFTEGASIAVSATGAFTDALTNAESYLGYIKAASNAHQVVVEDNKLAVVEGAAKIYCAHCDQLVQWLPMPLTNGGADYPVYQDGHYYLTQDLPKVTSQFYIGISGTATPDVVIDLQGYNVTATSRVFYIRQGIKLTIMDTVGSGVIPGSNTATGAIGYGERNSTFSFYSGTIRATDTTTAKKGGAIYVETGSTVNIAGGAIHGGYAAQGGAIMAGYQNTVNISGGTIYGSEATGNGGSLYISNGTLNMTGGAIIGGKSGSGGSIYLTNCNANLLGGSITGGSGSYGGNLHVADNGNATTGLTLGNCTISGGTATGAGKDIYFSSTGKLRVLTTFAGNCSVAFNAAHLPDKTPGAALSTSLDSAEGYFPGKLILESISTKPQLRGAEGESKLYIASAALVDDQYNLSWYAHNKSAIANYGSSICIFPAAGSLELKGGNYVVDLGSKKLNITGSGSVLCFDSANEDFKTYGTATISGPTLANAALTDINGKDYVAVCDNGVWSFHRLEMDITGVALRPSAAGFYYTGIWQMDEKLAAHTAQFGVAVSVAGKPSLELMAGDQMLYTAFNASHLQNGTPITGALIADVLKANEEYNDVRGRTSVFGATYLALTDGTVLISDNCVNYSLYDVVKLLDENGYTQNRDALDAVSRQWNDVLSGWQLQNIGKDLLEKNGINLLKGDVLYATDFENETLNTLPAGWSAGLYGGTGTSGTAFGWTGSGGSISPKVTELAGYGKVYQVASSNADGFTAMPQISANNYLYEAKVHVMRKGAFGLMVNTYAPTNEATGAFFTGIYPATTDNTKYVIKGKPSASTNYWEEAYNPAVGEVIDLQILCLEGKNYMFAGGKLMAVANSRAGFGGVDHPGIYTCGGGVNVLEVKVTEILSANIDIAAARLGLGNNTALMELDVSFSTAQSFFRDYMAGKFQDVKFGAAVLVADSDVSAALDTSTQGAQVQYFPMDALTVTADALKLTVSLPLPPATYERFYCIRPFVLADGSCVYSQGHAYVPVNLANSAWHNAPNEEVKTMIEQAFGSLPGFIAGKADKKVTFTLFSDFHYRAGMYPATIADLNAIMKRADDSNSAFVLSAGDFTNDAMNSPELFNAFLNYRTAEGSILPAYNIYGNHELEIGNTMEFMTPLLTNDKTVFWGTADGSFDANIGYYCFEKEGFRIICLDTEYSFNPATGQWEHNRSGSSGWPSGNTLGGSLGPAQLAWLEAVLMDAASKDIPCIVVAHDGFSGLGWATTSPDAETVRALYAKANAANPGTVLMSINGHMHTNHQGWNDGVFYLDVNTVRNAWWQETKVSHYTDEHTYLYEEYDAEGNLVSTYECPLSELSMAQNTWFSADPLSCVVTVSADGTVTVDGAQSDWAYGIAPSNTWEGVMCEITSGTYWDCEHYGHINGCEHN